MAETLVLSHAPVHRARQMKHFPFLPTVGKNMCYRNELCYNKQKCSTLYIYIANFFYKSTHKTGYGAQVVFFTFTSPRNFISEHFVLVIQIFFF